MSSNFQIARVSPKDAAGLADNYLALRELVLEKDDLYPGIKKWFDSKVKSGLRSNERVAYVGYVNEQPAVSAIVRLGSHAKICHINICHELQDQGLGELFFSLLAMEARRHAKSIYLTLPQNLWASKWGFFKDFGFTDPQKANRQYRFWDEELLLEQKFDVVRERVVSKLPKLASHFSLAGNELAPALLFSIQPEFTAKIMAGSKTVEVRRRFSRKWEGKVAAVYATSPVTALVGQVNIGKVHRAKPSTIWAKFGSRIGCSADYFAEYVAGCDQVFAIELWNARPFIDGIHPASLQTRDERQLTPPQSYIGLESNDGWSKVVSLAVAFQALHKKANVKLDPTCANGVRQLLIQKKQNSKRVAPDDTGESGEYGAKQSQPELPL